MVFQHFNLFPHKTVLDNIILGPQKVKGMSKSDAEKIAKPLKGCLNRMLKKLLSPY